MKFLLLFAITTLAQAAHSQYKLRIQKSFIKRVLARNLGVVFEHTEAFQISRAYLPDVDAYLTDFSFSLRSANRHSNEEEQSADLNIEVFMVP
jgi:hypothetical protein